MLVLYFCSLYSCNNALKCLTETLYWLLYLFASYIRLQDFWRIPVKERKPGGSNILHRFEPPGNLMKYLTITITINQVTTLLQESFFSLYTFRYKITNFVILCIWPYIRWIYFQYTRYKCFHLKLFFPVWRDWQKRIFSSITAPILSKTCSSFNSRKFCPLVNIPLFRMMIFILRWALLEQSY